MASGDFFDFDSQLAQARQELQQLANAATGTDGSPPEGHGEAADGMVRVTAVDGRLSAVELDARAMRLASHELAQAFTEAANAALTDLTSRYPTTSYPDVDLGALEKQLAEAQQQAAVQMRRYEQSIAEALRQAGQ
jgi:DNA-binding protein YbaB